MEPKKDDLTPEQESEAMELFLEALGMPTEVIEQYREHLREHGPNVSFEWHREDGSNDTET